ncbi:aromatic amino acid lyase [Sodalis sp. (in: enterobacteria)]|uniref:aromatic amino acid lyase n=1 Tax=Sodalis sp. (in: enterobacteria) TaxID=1898979 RepID=UPI003F37A6D8
MTSDQVASISVPLHVDSLPTSANQEDHVSMATYAARRLGDMCFNTAVVVGIEAMTAAQGIDFNRPLQSSALMESQLAAIRQRVAFLERDRLMAPDIAAMRDWVAEQPWPQAVLAILPSYAPL